MNVGIFAGGFKPFHVGHFSRLNQSISQCDMTYVFYGLSSRRKGSGIEFTEENAKYVFSIMKNAIESEYKGKVKVVYSKNPVTSAYDIIAENIETDNNVKIFGRLDDIKPRYMSNIGTEKESKYFGSMISENRVSFVTDVDSECIRKYFPDKSVRDLEKYSKISGEEIRKMIKDSNIDELISVLPPILTLKEKIGILINLKVKIEKPKTVAHINHLYEKEATELSLNEFHDLINDILTMNIENAQEKIDGQNLTFTYYEGELCFLTKGPTVTRVINSAKSRSDIINDYSHIPAYRDSLLWAMSILEPSVRKNSHLFREGLVVVEAALVTRAFPNTIKYSKDEILLISANSVIGNMTIDHSGFEKLFDELTHVTCGLVSRVPKIDTVDDCFSQSSIRAIHDQITALYREDDVTVADMLTTLAHDYISSSDMLDPAIALQGARRIATGMKQYLTAKECNSVSPDAWSNFKKMESNRQLHMLRIIAPLEDILLQIHHGIQKKITTRLVCENKKEIDDIVNGEFDEAVGIEAVRYLKTRSHMTDYTEGIVFDWGGMKLKMTGNFTRLNRAKWAKEKNK